MAAQGSEFLSSTRETWMEFLAPGWSNPTFKAIGGVRLWMKDLPLASCLCLSLPFSLSVTPPFK